MSDKPVRTLEEWVQRQQFLSAIESARNWLSMLNRHAVRYNWNEVRLLLALSEGISRDLLNTAPENNTRQKEV
ncbi:hypothetical protein HY28_005090 [Salmonella enterica subsp. enterica]|nr:hypothetical protein [Salmonella enterica subsp. enterica serovar Panama]